MPYTHPEYLIDAATLNSKLADDNLRVFDAAVFLNPKAGGGYQAESGHVPEANPPSVSGRSSWPQTGPRTTNAHEGDSQVRVIIGCGGPLRTALSGGVWGAHGGGDYCVARRRTQWNLGTRCQTRRHPPLNLAAGGLHQFDEVP
jgi:hypothetical protein